MKYLKIVTLSMIAICFSVCVSAQMQFVKTSAGKLVNYGRVDTLTTFNATPVIIANLTITDNTAGIVEITAIGTAATGDAITGKLIYRYKKVSGTLTVATADTASAITADTALSGGTFAAAANGSNNLKLTVTGKASVNVRWRTVITPHYGY